MDIKTIKQVLPVLFKAGVTPNLIGAHGIGKSQSVKQLADDLGIGFIDLRIATMETGDLLGLPDFVEDEKGVKQSTKFMRPSFLPTDPDSKGILFLDEFNRAKRDILQAIFQLVLDRRIHEYVLPEGWHIVAAMNPATNDYTTSDVSDMALMDRFVHIKMSPTVKEWLEYAESKNTPKVLTSFIKDQSAMLEVAGEEFSLDVVTPSRRSWNALARVMEFELEKNVLHEVAMGLVGPTAATAFVSFIENQDKTITGKEVVNEYEKVKGQIEKFSEQGESNRSDILKNITEDLFKEVKGIKKLTKKQSENLKRYLMTVPQDLGFSFIASIMPVSDSFVETLANDDELAERYSSEAGKEPKLLGEEVSKEETK